MESEAQENPASASERMDQKKKRKRRAVLSCNECRRRKLKCDRELPCLSFFSRNKADRMGLQGNRCVNGGIASSCIYDQEVISAAKRSHTELSNDVDLLDPHKAKIRQLEERIAMLEAAHGSDDSSEDADDRLAISTEPDGMPMRAMFKGQSYATFSYGSSSALAIVVNFPALRPFMRQVYPNSTLARLHEDMDALEARARSNNDSRIVSIPSLRSLLPDRLTVDLLLKQYFDTFETTYRIIHIPSFWTEYETFWETQGEESSDLTAVILAILATVLCTSTHATPKYNPNGSTFRSKAIIWIKCCEAWLKNQSNKHRTLSTLQVRCLRLLALKTTCLKTKELYQEFEAHAAFMRAAGMHRDPSRLGNRCAPFDGEMRRRLWATTMEFELQSSIDRGMAPSIYSLEWDCAPPRNIDDEELTKDLQQLPPSKPPTVFTHTSYLHLCAQSLALRAKIGMRANSLSSTPNSLEIGDYEKELLSALDKIPKWTDTKSLQAWTQLDLQLRQLLLILHTPRALQLQARDGAVHRRAKFACLEYSITLIERHVALLESGNSVLCCIRSDYWRAALVISHIAYHASDAPDDLIMKTTQAIFDNAMEKALRLQEERSMRPGRGNHQYWYISAAWSLVKARCDPERAELLQRQVTDRVSKLFYRILSLQEEPGSEAAAEYLTEDVVISFPQVPPRAAPHVNVASAVTGAALPAVPEAYDMGGTFDFGDTSGWMLDDFWSLDAFPNFDFNG